MILQAVNKKVIAILLLRLSVVLAQFALSIVIVKKLGIVSSGYYFTAFSIAMIIAVVGRFGTEQIIVKRLVSGNGITKSKGNAILCCSFIAIIGLTMLPLLVVAADYYMQFGILSGSLGPETSVTLSRLLCGVVVYNGAIIVAQAFLSKNKQIPNILYLSLLWPLMLCVLIIVSDVVSPVAVANLFVWVNSIVLVVAIAHWFVVNGVSFDFSIWHELKALFASAKQLLSAELAVQVSNWFPILIVGVILSASDATVYTVAQRIALLLLIITQALNAYISPYFAKVEHDGGEALASRFKYINRLIYLLSFPIAFVLLVWPEMPLYFFDIEPNKAGFVIRALVVVQCVNICLGSSSMLLIMTGFEGFYKRAMIVNAVMLVVLSVPLVYLFGLTGILCAVGMATCAMALSIIISLKNTFGLKVFL